MIILVLIICIILIIINIFIIKYKNNLIELDLYNEEINGSFKSISIAVDKKEEFLEQSIEVIKNSNKRKYGKKNILDSLIKNKNKKLNLNEKINELSKNLLELNEIIDEDNKLKENKKLNDILYDINSNENNLNASIIFYNSVLEDINKKKKNIFVNLIWKKKDYLNFDEIILKKEEEFEILKEGK